MHLQTESDRLSRGNDQFTCRKSSDCRSNSRIMSGWRGGILVVYIHLFFWQDSCLPTLFPVYSVRIGKERGKKEKSEKRGAWNRPHCVQRLAEQGGFYMTSWEKSGGLGAEMPQVGRCCSWHLPTFSPQRKQNLILWAPGPAVSLPTRGPSQCRRVSH